MPVPRQNIQLNFAQGLDTKTDPFQVTWGKFLALKNAVFNKGGLLQKRNGYGALTTLPSFASMVTTFNGNLTAIGNNLQAYNPGTATWVDKGNILPVSINTLPLIRSNTQQTYADTAIAPNGNICTVFTDNVPNGSGGSNLSYKYTVADSVTGQNIVAPTVITSTGTVTYAPKVFVLGNYFIIVFDAVISATNHLQYIAVNIQTPTSVNAATDISTSYTPASTGSFTGVVSNNNLYLAWNGADGGHAIRVSYLDSTLTQHNTVTFAGRTATHMSSAVDTSNSTAVIYVSFYNSADSTAYTLAVNQQLNTVLAPTQILSTGTILNITSTANQSVCRVLYEVSNAYSYDSSIKTNYVASKTVTQAGTVSSQTIVIRSLGLASKAFLMDSVTYFLGVYASNYQPTYFLVSQTGSIVAKLAYTNGGGYYVTGLPSAQVVGTTVYMAYLFKDLLIPVNKIQGAATSAGVYAQTGVNLASFAFDTTTLTTAEIGQNLNVSGGFLWGYDGYVPVEQNFHVYPDYVEVTTSGSGGLITAQQYFYAVTYEWSDNQGNLFRSAPSVPVSITTSGATSTNTIHVPTLRLTAKTANPVKLVVYRWSAAQQNYFQATSITIPVMNDTTADSINITDTLADSSIIGNSLLYTTGGVLENTAAPAFDSMTLWQSRLWGIDAEDKNLLWFSKQVIEATPVEMSDLLTQYVPPTQGAQGSTGAMRALAPLDDRLIVFKRDAIYYISGVGPDNTGANNQYSDPVFITSVVGSENQASIVFMPKGLMFQSDKGIWLLGRDLSTSYIGAPVEAFTQNALVQSAVNVPGTNQVRFTLDSGITLMYDYYFDQWAVFDNVPAISSCIYEELHTYVNASGAVYQETPGQYLDGSRPVLLSFTTGWLNLSGLQGFERACEFYILGTYISPHLLSLQIGYDYNSSPSQFTTIRPDNYNGPYGSDSLYGGGSPYGGNGSLEQWRIFLQKQKCQSFQITCQEIFDPSYGTIAGAGFTMSGIDLTVGIKKSRPALKASRQAG